MRNTIMDRQDKLNFIFETGKHLRFYMDDTVMSSRPGDESMCSQLSTIQMRTAMQVSIYQPLSLSELAVKLGVSAPSASVMVDRLVDKKVLERQPDPEDRRRVQLTIHPDSKEGMRQLQLRFQEAFERIAHRVGDENVERWFQVMLQVRDLLKEEGHGKQLN